MTTLFDDIDTEIKKSVRFFWKSRLRQSQKQKESGKTDQGTRGSVTGGSQMDGFIDLIREALIAQGIPEAAIFQNKKVELPGFFRPTKEWDLLVVIDGHLLAAIEVKSQVGSFGNNFNNRTEEALGSATCLWTAYREGAFGKSARPWLGYLMILESAPKSLTPVQSKEPHFPVFPEFRGTSYAKRYEIFCRKIIRERLYDAACLLLTEKKSGQKGTYTEPDVELGLKKFFASLIGHVSGMKNLGLF